MPDAAANHRNGKSGKTVLTDDGPPPHGRGLMAKAPPQRRRFDGLTAMTNQIIRSTSSPNDNGPSPCDEGPLEGRRPVLPGVADGIQNGNLSC